MKSDQAQSPRWEEEVNLVFKNTLQLLSLPGGRLLPATVTRSLWEGASLPLHRLASPALSSASLRPGGHTVGAFRGLDPSCRIFPPGAGGESFLLFLFEFIAARRQPVRRTNESVG